MGQETSTRAAGREEALDHSSVERELLMKEVKGITDKTHYIPILSLYRVPALITWPGMISPGMVAGLMSTLDIMPTLLGLCGLESDLMEGITTDG